MIYKQYTAGTAGFQACGVCGDKDDEAGGPLALDNGEFTDLKTKQAKALAMMYSDEMYHGSSNE